MKDKRVFYILSLPLCMMMIIILLSGCGKSGARSGQANNKAAVTDNQEAESESNSAADNPSWLSA